MYRNSNNDLNSIEIQDENLIENSIENSIKNWIENCVNDADNQNTDVSKTNNILDTVSENDNNSDNNELEKESVIDLIHSQDSGSSFKPKSDSEKKLSGMKSFITKSNLQKNSVLSTKF